MFIFKMTALSILSILLASPAFSAEQNLNPRVLEKCDLKKVPPKTIKKNNYIGGDFWLPKEKRGLIKSLSKTNQTGDIAVYRVGGKVRALVRNRGVYDGNENEHMRDVYLYCFNSSGNLKLFVENYSDYSFLKENPDFREMSLTRVTTYNKNGKEKKINEEYYNGNEKVELSKITDPVPKKRPQFLEVEQIQSLIK